jgi:hypothetical protein
MKPKGFIIATLLLVLFLQAGNILVQADETPKLPKWIKECDKLAPVYPRIKAERIEDQIIDESKIDLSKPFANQNGLNFRIAFEKARSDYHAFMECAFEKIVEDMMGTSGGDTSGIFGANAPNLPEWSKPESACIPEKELVDSLKNGSPETLLEPLLKIYNDYVDYLQILYLKASEKIAMEQIGKSIKFEEIQGQNESFGLLVENEIQDALAALDGAFIGLKEMRQAFVMHVHFQCMLKNLEFYRRAMENLRRVVSALPSVIEDASIHK